MLFDENSSLLTVFTLGYSWRLFTAAIATSGWPRCSTATSEEVDRLRLLPDPHLAAYRNRPVPVRPAQSRTAPSQLPANAGEHDAALTGAAPADITATEPQRHQFPMQPHPIPAHLWPTPLDELDVRIDRARPLAALPRLPAALIRSQRRTVFRSAPLPPCHHLLHQVRTQQCPSAAPIALGGRATLSRGSSMLSSSCVRWGSFK